MVASPPQPAVRSQEAEYSLFQLLRPGAIADPYPLYKKLREFEPVHWDPYLNSWVVTSYAECLIALQKFQASRTPSQESLEDMGLEVLQPYAKLMLKQLLFLDPPSHTRIRSMCSSAFTPRRMEIMRERLTQIAHALIDQVAAKGCMDLVADFARPFPALVLATLIGLPEQDSERLIHWAGALSELLGNFEHDPDSVEGLVASCLELQTYLHGVLADQRLHPGAGVMSAMMSSEVEGEPSLTDEEIVANVMLMIGGGLEEPANLICVGMLSMLQQHGSLAQLADLPSAMPCAVEELLRFNSSTQHTGRVAPEDLVLGGKNIRKGQSVTVVLAAANRDPLRFANPDKLDLTRQDNRHLAFGWAAHYCLGAPLARLAGQIALTALVGRLKDFAPGTAEPRWRQTSAMRGLLSLPLKFAAIGSGGR